MQASDESKTALREHQQIYDTEICSESLKIKLNLWT